MKCILLCAGFATRMLPLTEDFPKPLLPVCGKPIINYLIDDVYENNLADEIIVVSNNKFLNAFQNWKKKSGYQNISIISNGINSAKEGSGMVETIDALEKLKINDTVLALAGDNLLDFSLKNFVKFAEKKKSSCVMYHEENDITKLKRTGVAVIKDSKILEMEEKPQNPKSNFAIPPFYIYTKNTFKDIKSIVFENKVSSLGQIVIGLCKKHDVYAYKMPGKRLDIGVIETYLKVKDNPDFIKK